MVAQMPLTSNRLHVYARNCSRGGRTMKQFWLGVIFVLASALAQGHHSTLGFFDPDQTIEIDGVITSIAWRNPHIRFGLEVTDDSGESVEWVRANKPTVNLWSLPNSRGKGRPIGTLAIGSRVQIINREQDCYKVKASGKSGWISKIQVSRVVRLDTTTGRPCGSKAPVGL